MSGPCLNCGHPSGLHLPGSRGLCGATDGSRTGSTDEIMCRCAGWQAAGERFRVGRTLGRTLYCDDVCIGMVATREIATMIVEKLNR